jgi:hypothetical protein
MANPEVNSESTSGLSPKQHRIAQLVFLAARPTIGALVGAAKARKGKGLLGAGFGAYAGLGGLSGNWLGGAAANVAGVESMPGRIGASLGGEALGWLGYTKAIHALAGKESPWARVDEEEKKAYFIGVVRACKHVQVN